MKTSEDSEGLWHEGMGVGASAATEKRFRLPFGF